MRGMLAAVIALALGVTALLLGGEEEYSQVENVTVRPYGATEMSLTATVGLFEDKTGKLSFEEIISGRWDAAFKRPAVSRATGAVHAGFSTSGWWARIHVSNPTEKPIDQVIEIANPPLDRIEFYRFEGDGYRMQLAGDSTVGRSVDIKGLGYLYRVTVPAHSTETYYVRMSGESLILFDIRLHNYETYIQSTIGQFDISILFFGFVIAAALYSLSIYAVVRETSYLLFGILISGVTGFFGMLWGHIPAYILPETTWAANILLTFFSCVVLFALTRFSREVLSMSENFPMLSKICEVLSWSSVLLFLISFISFRFTHLMMAVIGFMSLGIALQLSVRLWQSNQKYGKFFAISWVYFCGTSAWLPLDRVGIFPWPEFVRLTYQLSFPVLCVMFSVVFAKKFRSLVAEKEETLRIARDDAIAASQAKSQFLAMMSHELRTPLNAVIGFSDILRMEAMGALGHPRYKEYAQDIKDSGSHLLAIINDLLEISRIEARQIELVEEEIVVSELVRRCMRIIEDRAIERGLELKSMVADPLPALIGDETRVQQVLINLLYNAVKFTPKGGSIRLEAGRAENGGIEFLIVDTGIGIAEGDRMRVLEPFTQVDTHLIRRHEGVGLGLAIAKSILDMHGAKLEIAGDLGAGTTFIVAFPPERVDATG